MAKLVVDEASLVSVADAIRTKGGTGENLEFPNGFVDAVNAIESGGGGTEKIENLIDESGVLESTDGTATEKVEKLIDKAEGENLWYQYSGTLTSMSRWSGLPFERLPMIDFSKITSLDYKFSSMPNLKRIDYYINSENCKNFNSCFVAASKLEYVKGINTSKATNLSALFSGCSLLKTIDEPLDFSSRTDTDQWLMQCTILEKLMFKENSVKCSLKIPYSPLLTSESIQSIIDGLATVETAQILTLHATVKAKLTEEQLATITSKNWSVA